MDPPSFLPTTERINQMREGMAALKTWLDDLLQTGILNFDFSPENLQEIASRMVDTKLGGIAKRLRLVADLDRSATSWPRQILSELADIYLFVLYFNRWHELPIKFRQSLARQAGFSIRTDALIQQKGITDNWYVLGQSLTTEEKLQVRKTWITGINSSRFALLLDFSFGKNPFRSQWNIGHGYHGELKYFPGIIPLRAVLHEPKKVQYIAPNLATFPLLNDFFDQYAKALNKNPLIRSFPCSLRNMHFLIEKKESFLIDTDNFFVKTVCDEEKAWQIFAIAGGHPMNFFGEWDGTKLILLSYARNGIYFPITTISQNQ